MACFCSQWAVRSALMSRSSPVRSIIATAAAGAYTVTVALLVLVPTIDKATWYLPCIAGLTVLGSIIQFLTTKRLK